jgi:hypothetical protein
VARTDLQVKKALKGNKVSQVFVEQMVLQAKMASGVLMEKPDQLENKVILDMKVSKEFRVLKVLQAKMEFKV